MSIVRAVRVCFCVCVLFFFSLKIRVITTTRKTKHLTHNKSTKKKKNIGNA